MTPITGEIPDPERGGGTRWDPERARGKEPVDLARTGVVPERQGDKPVDPAPTGGKDDEIGRGSVGLGREGVEDAHPTDKAVDPLPQGLKGVEIERGSLGLGRQGVEDVHPERDSVNSVVPPRGGMDSELLSDADLALGVVNPIPDGGSLSVPRYAAESHSSAPWRFPVPRSGDPKSLAKAVMKNIADLLQSPDLEHLTPSKFRRFPSRPRRVPMPGPTSHARSRYRQIGWTSIGGESNSYRMLNRSEINSLKAELKQSLDVMKQGSKIFSECSEQVRIEHLRMRTLVEDYANSLKASLDTQAAAMNISREHAAELKILVDEAREALKALKSGRRLNWNKFREYARGPRVCAELAIDLSFFAALVTGALLALGYLQLEEPSSFNPRQTKAGLLLYDDFIVGIKVSCKSSFGPHDGITSMLSGEVADLQNQLTVERIKEKWRCQIGIEAGQDVLVKGLVQDLWVKGLDLKYNLPVYDAAERKVELKMNHCIGSVGGTFGLSTTPLVTLSAIFGKKLLSAGCLLDFDVIPRVVRRIALCGGFDIFGFSASAMMSKLFHPQAAGQQVPHPASLEELTLSLHYQVSESTAVGCQLTHVREGEEHHTSAAAGVEHRLGAATLIKAKLTNEMVLTGLLRHRIGERSSVSMCSTINLRALDALPRFGFSVSVAP